MKIIFARHGETDWNVRRLIQGHHDIELNDNGRRQAALLAEAVAELGVVHAYASDLKRAIETARIVAERHGIPHAGDARLRELHFGTLDGQPYAVGREQDAIYPHNHPDWPDPLAADFGPYGGESARAMFERQRAAIEEFRDRHRGETILVIGHGRSLRTLLHGLGHPKPHFSNCERFVVEL